MYAQMANNIEDMTIEELRTAYKKLEKTVSDKDEQMAAKDEQIAFLSDLLQMRVEKEVQYQNIINRMSSQLQSAESMVRMSTAEVEALRCEQLWRSVHARCRLPFACAEQFDVGLQGPCPSW